MLSSLGPSDCSMSSFSSSALLPSKRRLLLSSSLQSRVSRPHTFSLSLSAEFPQSYVDHLASIHGHMHRATTGIDISAHGCQVTQTYLRGRDCSGEQILIPILVSLWSAEPASIRERVCTIYLNIYVHIYADHSSKGGGRT